MPGPFLLSNSVFVVNFSYFFVSVPCQRLGWPSHQLLSARKCTVSYRIVSYDRLIFEHYTRLSQSSSVQGPGSREHLTPISKGLGAETACQVWNAIPAHFTNPGISGLR